MKKIYARPEIEINAFDTEDIMTASGNTGRMTIDGTADLTTGGSGADEIDAGNAE